MRPYRTEVVVPPDRYVFIQLPDDWPAGRAFVTVTFGTEDEPPGTTPAAEPPAGVGPLEDDNDDRQDVEWWEEFGDDRGPAG